ncbi:TonB-dependent receptor [Sphingomonas jatrophae]|uniref:Outer membrane receptor proteins, mostly Fe transport n=1 Tax=Sphingomonas jatrophae TaxID=1166337 RepID=A0A1I6LKU2_9SPHN|nr:TonB-dependent receptor [Sphingomonas jatrophae]SFS04076.1 Outer membrane receptor proteins, mostly Fe transport [Sphingomonas jatrophae]
MKTSLWSLSCGLLALSTPALAQDATGNPAQAPAAPQGTPAAPPLTEAAADAAVETGAGNDIIVTATRRASPLSDVPIAVSAVTAASLQNSGATDIRQLNQLAPSLLVSSSGSEANGSARVRGIGTVGDNPGLESSVAVFVDGVYRSRSGIGLNELGEVERVEVLRGPQGTLFGRNASAGLINIVSKRPSYEESGAAEFQYGNYDMYRGQLSLTGPIIDQKLAYRIDGVFVKRDGFYDNVTAAGGSERDVNDRDRWFVRGQLLFEPTERLTLRLIGDYTRRNESCCGAVYISQRETFDPTVNVGAANTDGAVATAPNNRIVDVLRSLGATFPLAGNTVDPYSRDIAVTPGRSFRNKTTDYGGSLQADLELGDAATLTSITAYRQYRAGGEGDVDYTNVDIAYRPDDNFRRFKTFTQELRLQGSLFNDRLDWLVGGFYTNEKLRLVDRIVFGTQYGAFAACRIVATANPLGALRNPAAPGCLTPIGRGALGASFGAAAPAVLGALDRLSTVNNVGDQGVQFDQKSENWALFTHNIFNITDKLSLTLGLRYTNETKTLDANFNNNNTVCPTQQAALGPLLASAATPAQLRTLLAGIVTLTCQGNSSSLLNAITLNDKRKEDEFTGTAVISFKPSARLLTYASYSKGYKAGGFNLDRSALGSTPGNVSALSPRSAGDVADLQYAAEKVDAFEIGAKYSTRRFSLNVAAFRQEFSNFQLNTFNGSVFIVQNVQACGADLNGADRDASGTTGACPEKGKAGLISQGVELEASINPVRDVQVTAGYTYADTHFRNNLIGTSRGATAPLDPALFLLPGAQLSNAPKNTVTASFAWTPELTSSGISGLLYVDTRMTSKYNTGSDLAPEKEQQGYEVVNARIGIRGPDSRWALEFWGQNVFNAKYTQVAFNSPYQGSGSVANVAAFGGVGNSLYSAYLAEPRTYGVTVRTRF